MYGIYCDECKLGDQKPLSRFTFSNVFHGKKLSILKLKKDKCDTCVGHETGQISREDWDEHMRQKKRARLEKENDTKMAKDLKLCVSYRINFVANHVNKKTIELQHSHDIY